MERERADVRRSARVAGQMLEPDRRLPFERRRPGEADQRGNRVEQTAHRRARRDPNTGAQQRGCLSEARRKIERRRASGRAPRRAVRESRLPPAPGCRAAASPPAMRTGRRHPTRLEAARARCRRRAHRPTCCHRRRIPCRRSWRRRRACPTPGARRAPTRCARDGAESGARSRGQLLGPRRRAIARMRVTRDEHVLPRHVVEPHQIANRRLERLDRPCVLEIADVLAHERLAVDHQRDAVLEVGAEREHGSIDRERRHRTGCVARARDAGSSGRADRCGSPSRPRGARSDARRRETRRRGPRADRMRRRPGRPAARPSDWRWS